MKKNKEKKKIHYTDFFPLLLFISTIFISMGYALMNSITTDIEGTVISTAQDKVFITDVSYVSDNNANLSNSKVNSYFKTVLNSTISLSDTDNTSSITYKITVYNSDIEEYTFIGTLFDENFYDNENITFELDGIEIGDKIQPKTSQEFNITFHYKDNQLAQNILNSYLNFSYKREVNVTYENIPEDVANPYPHIAYKEDEFSVTLNTTPKALLVKMNDTILTKEDDYLYENNTLTINNINGDIKISDAYVTPLIVEYISSYEEINLADNVNGVEIEVKVTNNNEVPIEFNLKTDHPGVVLLDNNEEKDYTIGAEETKTYKLLLTTKEEYAFVNSKINVNLILHPISVEDNDIDYKELVVLLQPYLKNIILSSFGSITPAPESYTGVETSNGYLMSNAVGDSTTYYYRGVVENNYIRFADKLWRIIRIDSYGNIRIVLDDLASQSVFNSNYSQGTVSSVEEAANLVDYRNSNLRQNVESWYESNVANHQDNKFIVPSNFCVEIGSLDPITTPDGFSVAYFTPYINVGRDTNTFKPNFVCSTEGRYTANVGLISAMELFAAGAYWNNNNTSFYLAKNQTFWSLSASYFDVTRNEAGVIWMNNGTNLSDWTSGGNLNASAYIRPVVSIEGSVIASGKGTKTDPFIIEK